MIPAEWTTDEAAAVIEVIINRWPGGVANKGWDLGLLEGYVGEIQVDGLTPALAISGLRASPSGFIPSVGQVRELAREALGPMTGAQFAEAEEQFRIRKAKEAAKRLAAAGPAPELGMGGDDG